MKPSSLNDNIVYLCSEFSHQFQQLLKRRFREKNLQVTSEQLAVLVFLYYNGTVTQKQLAEGLNRDKTTLARVVQNMEKTRLVTHIIHPEDSRAKLISLTSKGQKVQQKALSVSGQIYSETVGLLKPDTLRALTNALHTLLNSLQGDL